MNAIVIAVYFTVCRSFRGKNTNYYMFLGILTQVTNLEAPYGICKSNAAPKSICAVNNEMTLEINTCGCYGVFAGVTDTSPGKDIPYFSHYFTFT